MTLVHAMIIAYIPFFWGVWQLIKDENSGKNVAKDRYNSITIDKDDAL